jgi:hypothetical protein
MDLLQGRSIMTERFKPTHEICLGRIRASIWANQSGGREVWYNVTVSRLYKDGEQWKDAAGFGRDDLPLVAKVADMAYAWIWAQNRRSAEPAAGS